MSEKTMYTAQEIDDIVKSCRGLRKQLIEYCMKYLASFEDAEDCVSFAFTKLVEELKDGKAITSPKAWLYKVSINEAIRLAREANKRCENLFRDSEYKDAVIEESEVYEPDYLDELIDDERIISCALKIINSLSKDEKELYIKYYVENKLLKDIAGELGLSYTAVRKRSQRLKKKLEQLVNEAEENYYEEGSDSNE